MVFQPYSLFSPHYILSVLFSSTILPFFFANSGWPYTQTPIPRQWAKEIVEEEIGPFNHIFRFFFYIYFIYQHHSFLLRGDKGEIVAHTRGGVSFTEEIRNKMGKRSFFIMFSRDTKFMMILDEWMGWVLLLLLRGWLWCPIHVTRNQSRVTLSRQYSMIRIKTVQTYSLLSKRANCRVSVSFTRFYLPLIDPNQPLGKLFGYYSRRTVERDWSDKQHFCSRWVELLISRNKLPGSLYGLLCSPNILFPIICGLLPTLLVQWLIGLGWRWFDWWCRVLYLSVQSSSFLFARGNLWLVYGWSMVFLSPSQSAYFMTAPSLWLGE